MSSQRIFDANLVLRAAGTATESENLTPLTNFYPGKVYCATAEVVVTAAAGTLTPKIQASANGTDWVTIAEAGPISAAGRYELVWSGLGSEALCPGANQVRLASDISGQGASFTYSSFLTKCACC